MSLRFLVNLRQFSTCRTVRLPVLSDNYRSKALWENRYSCQVLTGDVNTIKSINSKIIVGQELNSLEVDIFTNIARSGDDQLQESVRILKKFRKSLYAHTLMPSTPHAVCRLFLGSQRLSSLVSLLEDRINYGIFPDFFVLNLILDTALDQEKYVWASRVASIVMLQEEFGINPITDVLSLTAISKYIESKTNFSDWLQENASNDPILTGQLGQNAEQIANDSKKEPSQDDEEEEEIEYIRIPFLRNPYCDNHFDLKNPRVICGKTFTMLGNYYIKSDKDVGLRCQFMGNLLQGKWSSATDILVSCQKAKTRMGPLKELAEFYLENLNEVTGPTDDEKASLLSNLSLISQDGPALSASAEAKCKSVHQYENQDIGQFKQNLLKWSKLRIATKKALDEREVKRKLVEEIKAKKLELERKEQYLYYFDNLKKSRLTRLDYE